MRSRISLVLAAAAAAAAAVLWSTTLAAGAGPSPGVLRGGSGLKNGELRYVALANGSGTLVEALDPQSRVVQQRSAKGKWGLPLVAYDNTVEGLVQGGRTLLLAQDIYGADGELRAPTSFKLLDAHTLEISRDITIPGTFSFDAASPDGRYVYLIEYFSSADPTLYRVRAYDLRAGKLLAKIVADRRSWATGMQGIPISRTWKNGWAYTLYGGNARPFIHALDAGGLEAVCINLPWQRSPERIFDYRLRTDRNGHLVVRGPHGRAVAVIDRRTFKILSSVKNP
jgi:hypothetical protein